MHNPPVKPYAIRDKVYIISLYKYGEGEQPFKEVIVMANSEQDAKQYYYKYKDEWPTHQAIGIRRNE